MNEEVKGYCPNCGHHGLFLGSGGYITCPAAECDRPDAATDILADREIHHIVTLRENDFTIRHPLIERLDDGLLNCELHAEMAALSGPPRVPGRYRVFGGNGERVWDALRADGGDDDAR